jgi:hypothetical protein
MATLDGTLGADRVTGTLGADLILGAPPLTTPATAPALATIAAGGLGIAVLAVAAPGEAGRLWVLDKRGIIRSVDSTTGAIDATPVLNMTAEVSASGEQGLLGLAFHPDFWANGRVFVFFSNLAGDSVVRAYTTDPADRGRLLPARGSTSST